MQHTPNNNSLYPPVGAPRQACTVSVLHFDFRYQVYVLSDFCTKGRAYCCCCCWFCRCLTATLRTCLVVSCSALPLLWWRHRRLTCT